MPAKTEWGTAQVIRFDDMPTESVGETYRRSVVRGDDVMVSVNWFEPGHPRWPAAHSHPFDQLMFVLSGKMLVTLAEQELEVEAPSVVWIPKDMPHSGDIIGNQPCLNIDVFGVVREDFLHLTEYQDDRDGAA